MGRHLRKAMSGFWRDQRAATAIEYGMIAALISILVLTAVTSIGTEMLALFEKARDGLK